MKGARFYSIFLFCFMFSHLAASPLFQGQWSNWFNMNQSDAFAYQYGTRYIPQLSGETDYFTGTRLDFEASLNNLVYISDHSGTHETYGVFELHRLWFRLSAEQYEIRAGLQKINFGSASLFRPLMWFDRMDARDPLQLTQGVWGVLGKYYFLQNHTIWAWGLLGNKDPKGWEIFGTSSSEPEFGGRIQFAVPRGELAFTTHFRKANATFAFFGIRIPGQLSIREKRFGLDGKWDLKLGLWFEGVLIHQDLPISDYKIRELLTLGADYTFDLGNGLYVMAEHFSVNISDKVLKRGTTSKLTALSMMYPLGILDQISLLSYVDWENSQFYQLINWQRSYDHWQWIVLAFLNPETASVLQFDSEHHSYSGKGIQIMLVFNH